MTGLFYVKIFSFYAIIYTDYIAKPVKKLYVNNLNITKFIMSETPLIIAESDSFSAIDPYNQLMLEGLIDPGTTLEQFRAMIEHTVPAGDESYYNEAGHSPKEVANLMRGGEAKDSVISRWFGKIKAL
jgi:hypothetical protein